MNQTARTRLPPYIPWMLVITAAYLTVEIPFSTHLVDVLGSNPTPADINAIEEFGRFLTGFAVAIAVVGGMLAKADARAIAEERRRGLIPPDFIKALVVGAGCVAVTYLVLDFIAEAIGNYSGGASRKAAMISVMGRQAISGADDLFGDIPDDQVPAWKAFLSVAPLLDAEGKLMGIAKVDRNRMIADEATGRLGPPAAFRKAVFGSSFDAVRRAYDEYKAGSDRYAAARADVERKVDRAWAEYVSTRENAGMRIIRNRSQLDTIRKHVIERGVPVPSYWDPNDRGTFEAVLRDKLMRDVRSSYVSAIQNRLGKDASVEPGLSFEAFLAEPEVQRMIRKNLNIGTGGGTIRPTMSDAQFMEAVYRPALAAATKEIADSFSASASDFQDGSRFGEMGRTAAQSAFIPTLAILLSLAGAFLHICKITGYLAQTIGYLTPARVLRSGYAKWGLGSAAAAVFGVVMLMPANAVTTSDPYIQLASSSGPFGIVLGASIAIQPSFKQVGQTLGGVGLWSMVSSSMPHPQPRAVPSKATPAPVAKNAAK